MIEATPPTSHPQPQHDTRIEPCADTAEADLPVPQEESASLARDAATYLTTTRIGRRILTQNLSHANT